VSCRLRLHPRDSRSERAQHRSADRRHADDLAHREPPTLLSAVEMDAAGNVKPTKRNSDKIDGVVALIIALDHPVHHISPRRSVYDDSDLEIV
jgi:hypothetical protein